LKGSPEGDVADGTRQGDLLLGRGRPFELLATQNFTVANPGGSPSARAPLRLSPNHNFLPQLSLT
jgi:hypothetical protein